MHRHPMRVWAGRFQSANVEICGASGHLREANQYPGSIASPDPWDTYPVVGIVAVAGDPLASGAGRVKLRLAWLVPVAGHPLAAGAGRIEPRCFALEITLRRVNDTRKELRKAERRTFR